MSLGVGDDDLLIFPDPGVQHNRKSTQSLEFGKVLARALGEEDISALLAELTLKRSDLGTHSIRKGALTFACSGSTEAPSLSAVCLRAGWTMGSVQDKLS